MAGIASAWLLVRYDLAYPRLAAAVGVIAFVAFGAMADLGLFFQYGLVSKFAFGLASTIVLLGLISAERQRLIRIGPIGVLIGGASYSLYLIHPLANGLTVRALATLGVLQWLPTVIVVVMMAGTSILASVLLHLRVEMPIMTAIRAVSSSDRRSSPD